METIRGWCAREDRQRKLVWSVLSTIPIFLPLAPCQDTQYRGTACSWLVLINLAELQGINMKGLLFSLLAVGGNWEFLSACARASWPDVKTARTDITAAINTFRAMSIPLLTLPLVFIVLPTKNYNKYNSTVGFWLNLVQHKYSCKRIQSLSASESQNSAK